LYKFFYIILINISLLSANSDISSFFKPHNLEKNETICIHKEHNITSAAIGCIPATAKCIKSFQYKATNLQTIAWVKVEFNGKIGWTMARWLQKDTNCNTENNRSGTVDKLLNIAKSKIGSKYEYAKAGPDTFDCSGFVYWAFKEINATIPRTSINQSKIGTPLKREKLKPGDILFFDTANRGHVNHSGIYLGNGKFIHASSGKAFSVTVSPLDKGFYLDKFKWGVRRVKMLKNH